MTPSDNSPQDDRRRVLAHLAIHPGSTPEVIGRACLGGRSNSAVDSFMRRMMTPAMTPALVATQPLYARRRGYRLTIAGARMTGAPREAARPLGPQARVNRMAVAWHLYAPGSKRRLVPASELRTVFRIDAHRLPRRHFYLDESGAEARLGYLVVDHGAQVRRVVRKTTETLARFLKLGWFDDLIAQGRLQVTVLTPTVGKQRAIRLHLGPYVESVLGPMLKRFRGAGADPIQLEVVVVDELDQLVIDAWRVADRRRSETKKPDQEGPSP